MQLPATRISCLSAHTWRPSPARGLAVLIASLGARNLPSLAWASAVGSFGGPEFGCFRAAPMRLVRAVAGSQRLWPETERVYLRRPAKSCTLLQCQSRRWTLGQNKSKYLLLSASHLQTTTTSPPKGNTTVGISRSFFSGLPQGMGSIAASSTQ